jgi:hypothetical protein
MNGAMNFIPVWEAVTGQQRCRLEGHEGPTAAVAFGADGRTLASAGNDGSIRLWDVETGKPLRRLTGHRGTVSALAFTPDGQLLLSAGDDTTVLFWDVAAVTRRGRPVERLTAKQAETLWADLAGEDAAGAHRAMARLSAAPEVSVPALRERLRPVPAVDADRLAKRMAELDADEFAIREQASQELVRMGEAVRAALERERRRAELSPERRRRLDDLLQRLWVPPAGDRLRELRAVEVLERIGTAEARRVLEALATGAAEARLTQEAKAALQRLGKRPPSGP